ncbi:MAG: succinylglutamate desuccinylase/aspartoacylase family protein [Proteobacteria bacterium]|nr:succinylglutamate desuccinylase/aspartoacylase family protein [Pseudomonadota bacterium]
MDVLEEQSKRTGDGKRPPIIMGGVEVGPGERRVINLPLANLSTHTSMAMPVQVIHGRRDGPKLFVCAAMHGDEINGVEIIRRLLNLSSLRRLRGTLFAVPIVNVMGFVTQSRYLPDRRDLNRSFPGSVRGSLAGRLARLFLDEVVSKATHGIDLHTGAIHRDNFPQIRGNLDDPETDRLARAFGVPAIINTGFRHGSLREAAAKENIPVIVYEAGEALRFDESCIRAGLNGVTNVMRNLNMLSTSRSPPNSPQLVIGSTTWVRAPQSGLARKTTALGRQVRAGDTLGIIGDPFGENEVEIKAPADGIVIGRSNLPVVNEGDALFHIACHEGKQVVARSLDAFEPEAEYEKGLTSELADEPQIV